jgi:hypothetical protein
MAVRLLALLPYPDGQYKSKRLSGQPSADRVGGGIWLYIDGINVNNHNE